MNPVLECHLIKAWLSVSGRRATKATISDEDVDIAAIGELYYFNCVARLADSRYLMTDDTCSGSLHNYWQIDVDSKTAAPWLTSDIRASAMYVKDDLVVMVCLMSPMLVVKDNQILEAIPLRPKTVHCSKGWLITNRWSQELDGYIYVIESESNDLHKISWSDIKLRQYETSIIEKDIDDFAISRRAGMAVIRTDKSISVNCKQVPCIKHEGAAVGWNIVVRAADRWIVAGSQDCRLVMASIKGRSAVVSSIADSDSTIQAIKLVVSYRSTACLLAVTRNGRCFVVSMRHNGRLTLLHSISNIITHHTNRSLPDVVLTVAHTKHDRVFLVGGSSWMKLMTVRIK